MPYISPTKAMSHQKEALRRRALRPPGYADAFADIAEMGCGKSKIILDEWQDMVTDGYIQDLLIVAPAGCLRNWYKDKGEDQLSELNRHLDPKLLKLMRIAAWERGKTKKQVQELVQSSDPAPRALFVNVEAISTSEEVVRLCRNFLLAGRGMLVIDEATVIRAGATERTKAIVRVIGPHAKARRILTGLITPKSPMDLFWQFYFLDPKILGYDEFTVFQQRYAVTRRACYEKNPVIRNKLKQVMGLNQLWSAYFYREKLRLVYSYKKNIPDTMPLNQIKEELETAAEGMERDDMVECIFRLGGWIKSHIEIKEFKNLEELQQKIAPFSYRILKSECMDLPPKIYAPLREIELTTEQARMYKEMLKFATTELEGQHVTSKSVIAQMLRLHQITLGYSKDETGVIFDIPSNRLKALIEILEDHSGKAIIWCSYRHEIDKIVVELSKKFGPQSVAQYHGGNVSTRDEDERRFITDSECLYMVSTQAAGGRGNTWIEATLSIYYSNSYDLEHRLQSEDRNHRKGQIHPVTYADLVVRGTVEEKIIQALRNKIDLATIITAENYRAWLI